MALAYAASIGGKVSASLLRDLGAFKSVDDVVSEFEVALSERVVDVFNAESSVGDLSRSMRTMVRVYGRMAYTEGMREGGVDDPEKEISDEDEAEIAKWIAGQLEHVAGFAQAAGDTRKSDNRRDAQAAVLARFDMWLQSLRDIGSRGKASAMSDRMVTWKLGATEDHCPTCSRLNGSRHRLSWFMARGYRPQENGSESLACGGWRCECVLIDDKGEVVYPA